MEALTYSARSGVRIPASSPHYFMPIPKQIKDWYSWQKANKYLASKHESGASIHAGNSGEWVLVVSRHFASLPDALKGYEQMGRPAKTDSSKEDKRAEEERKKRKARDEEDDEEEDDEEDDEDDEKPKGKKAGGGKVNAPESDDDDEDEDEKPAPKGKKPKKSDDDDDDDDEEKPKKGKSKPAHEPDLHLVMKYLQKAQDELKPQ